jgi:peroxiredoxin Q/BCP
VVDRGALFNAARSLLSFVADLGEHKAGAGRNRVRTILALRPNHFASKAVKRRVVRPGPFPAIERRTLPMSEMTLPAGAMAPDFSLPGDGGTTKALKDFAGKALVLYFYPKDDTSGCTKEAMEFNALRADFAKAGAEILGVSADSVASHDKFKKKYDLGFSLASDESKAMLEAYGVWAEKSMYGKKYMGIERTTYLIDRAGKVQRVWNKVKVPGHAAEVLEAAKSL